MFARDLTFGKVYEKKFMDYIDYDEVEKCPDGKFSKWDVRIKKGDGYKSFEIKADKLSAKTGNFCIEYECSGRPSGLATTEADYYGYFVIGEKDDCYIIPTDVLRKECVKPFVKSLRCGDGYRARAYLLPVHEFYMYKVEKRHN
jgi:hypothetical protein